MNETPNLNPAELMQGRFGLRRGSTLAATG